MNIVDNLQFLSYYLQWVNNFFMFIFFQKFSASINSALLAVDPAMAARISHTDRPNMSSDSLLRLQAAAAASNMGMGGANSSFAVDNPLAGPGLATGELSHTHTHTHTHLHLHQPDPSTAAATSIFPPLHPFLAAASASPFVPSPGFNLPGLYSI